MFLIKKVIPVALLSLVAISRAGAQQLDLDNLLHFKDKYFRYGGGVFLNTIYTNSNDDAIQRQPFTYVVGGNVNLQLMSFSLPFTFSYTNQKFQFSQPFKFNRLSVHPKYKWITAHIGDIAMNFSPYSLSGHLFTGTGLELTPPTLPVKLSLLYGRFLRATEPDSFNLPAYARWGWGVKAEYEHKRFTAGLSVFHAKDRVNSLQTAPDFRNVFPMENLVLSGTLNARLASWLQFDAEYAASSLTRDIRERTATESEEVHKTVFSGLMTINNASSVYHAYKAGISAEIFKATLRVGFEHVDPDYTTLGAYYFTNDFENYTISLNRSFLKNTLTVALTGGMQQDDLAGTKARSSKRWVGSGNVSWQSSERLNFTAMYSTFQSYSNMKSQFDFINQVTPYENADTLNYMQVSKNANVSMNWIVKKEEAQMQSFNANLAWQDASDKQGGVVRTGNASTLMNANLGYSVMYPKSGVGIMAGLNGTYNTVGSNDMYLVGPMMGINKVFIRTKIKTSAAVAYNNSFDKEGSLGSVWNLRGQAAYTLKEKHQLSLSLMEQFRKQRTGKSNNLFTASFNYAFAL